MITEPAVWIAISMVMLGEGFIQGVSAEDASTRFMAALTCSCSTAGIVGNVVIWLGWWP